tara:strand:- start:292 stop:435 length:144 start_codon:yes stop_codon:yes gene_type:complete
VGKKGNRTTRQAIKKKTKPNIPQKLPMEAIIKPSIDKISKIQPIELI